MTQNIYMEKNSLLLDRLHPELLNSIEDQEYDEQVMHRFFTVVFADITSKAAVDKINADFVRRKQMAETAWAKQRYEKYLMLVEPSSRATVFTEDLAPLLSDDQYWPMLRHLWLSHTLPPHWDGDIWPGLFAAPRKQRELLMSEEERAVLAALPKTLTVYRGGVSTDGIGWTLDKDKARFFAESFAVISLGRGHPPEEHRVFEGTASKNQVYAYFDEKGDEEVVLDPSGVTME